MAEGVRVEKRDCAPKGGAPGAQGCHMSVRARLVWALSVFALAVACCGVMPARAYAGPLEDAGAWLTSAGESIVSLMGLSSDAAPAAALGKSTTVDSSTLTTWEGIVSQDTENIGRIWTDKTVAAGNIELPASSEGKEFTIEKGDSDFLVGLSALSSTSNITTSSSVPLDIVLVLDTSGSMRYNISSGYEYTPTYSVDTNGRTTYYALNSDGTYTEIDRITTGFFQRFDHWELNGQRVEAKTSASDTDSGHIQFYTRSRVNVSKMDALKTAANNFIDATAAQNADIDDSARQHRVSIVSFASNGNLRQGLTECTDANKDSLKSVIDGLSANGATAADYGMQQAQDALASSREGAAKVVVFFTDGEPNHQNGFDDSVANGAITASKSLKDEGALVYSIGVFEGADPDNADTSTSNQFNAYMHAMSSNYPAASAWNNLGERAKDSNYYKAATDADELNAIFQEISEEINKGSGFPTEVTEGAADTSGYITFTDELGAYMQVDEFKDLVFADTAYKASKATDGNIDTYTYTGESHGNALYPEGEVSDIIVQVKRSDNLAQGDIVTVKVPAGLIPLRNFTVNSDDDGTTMDIAEAFPLRVFYGVSVKSGVADALRNGTADQELLNYIASNTKDGKTSFYSNWYDGTVTSGGKLLGNTTASFVPAEGNTFYYFTENTTLYTDADCTAALRQEPETGKTYYYKRSYYAMDSGTGEVTQKTSITRFVGANFDASTTFWGMANDGTYYIKAGAPRLTRIDDLTLSKTVNATGTSTEVINPSWDNINNPDVLNVYLGNNGKIDVELPGTLSITKDARVAPNKGISADVLDGKEFQFEISIPKAAGKILKAEVKNEQGAVTAPLFELTFDKQGKATHSIKDNETLYIYGIDAGSDYAVSEVADTMPEGFTQTSAEGDTGVISGNAVSAATFVNTYDVRPVTVDADDFAKYAKTFDRWDIADSFTIQLKEDNAQNPMPEGSTEGADGLQEKNVEVKQDSATGSFGDVAFAAVGTYTYTVMEKTPSTTVAGMTYSDAAYTVEVTVADNGKGVLEATSKMLKTSGDAGGDLDPYEEVPNKTATFVNSFNVSAVSAGPLTTKSYVNNGGADKNLVDGMFSFKVKAVGENAGSAPLPAGASPDKDGYIYVTNDGTSVAFGQATFTDAHVGKTYEYEISEVLPDGATADNGYTLDGMTYDPTAYIATFTVTSETVVNENRVKVDVSYAKSSDRTPIAGIPEFKNSYDPADTVLQGDAAIKVSKTLNGRDSLENETFDFTLTARSNATLEAVKNDEVVFGNDMNATELTATIGELTNGQEKTAGFDSITFTKPGTYTFNVVESHPADGSGMVYDKHTETVTVTVTDNNGVLDAKVSYSSGGDAAAFVNTYAAQANYSTDMNITVGKTLNGRAQTAGEFEFSFAGIKSDTVSADEADARLAASDKSFATVANAPNGVQSQMFNLLGSLNFTQADAGKTFSYELSETEGTLGGVTYDKTVYRIDIAVIDDGDGTMHTETTIKKTTADGAKEEVGTFNGADGLNGVTLGFENAYKAAPVDVKVPSDQALTKVLKGRDWVADDSFEFTLTAYDGAPAPTRTTAIADMPAGTQDGTETPFDFGTFTFDAPGLYHYTVTETNGGQTIGGVAYDNHTADIYIRVSDPGDGQLTASTYVFNRTFTNVYSAELNHNDAGGIVVTKTTDGHDMTQGQFTFRVETLDGDGTTADETAQRIGIKDGTTGDFGNIAGTSGVKVEMPSEHPITFTHEDAGKTFKLQISEQGADGNFGSGGTADGYTFSDAVYTVEMSVADDGKGALTLTTKVTDKDGKVSEQTSSSADPHVTYLDFVNTYTPDAIVVDPDTAAGAVTKVLAGNRDTQLAADEFTFLMKTEAAQGTLDTVKDAKGKAWPAEKTATNAADGSVDFGSMSFSAAGTYKVSITEVAGGDGHIAYDGHTFSYTIKVSYDPATGTLSSEVTDVSGAPEFTNVYTADDAKDVVAGDAQESLDGKVVRVGDELTYTIDWVNNALGADGAPAKADVTVTDVVPAGTEFVSAEAGGVHEDGTVTWSLGEQEPGACGTVSFTVKVTEDALVAGGVENEATIQVGDTDPVTTNKVTTKVETASLTVSKTVEVDAGQGVEVDADRAFTFKLELTDAFGAPLDGSYAIAIADGDAATIKSGGTFELKHGQSAVISGLPEGAVYTVTEQDIPSGYTVDEAVKDGSLAADGSAVAFVNTYRAESVTVDTSAGGGSSPKNCKAVIGSRAMSSASR